MTRSLLLAATILALVPGMGRAQGVSGLYIGGGGGVNFLQDEHIKSYRYPGGVIGGNGGQTKFDTGFVGLGSIGYGFGNGLRLELEGDFRTNRLQNAPTGSLGGREEKYGAMANVLFDLDVGSPYVFPYIGAGVGYQSVYQKLARTGNLAFILPGNNAVALPGGTITTDGTQGSFAYQAIAGLSFPIAPVVGLSLTVEYRYLAMTGTRDYMQTVAFQPSLSRKQTSSGDTNHDVLIGLRYAFNVVPPAIPAGEVPKSAVRESSRSYLVFFDWDRSDLTERARAIITEAAQATTRIAVTRIEVSGHADRSGTPQYNQGLSQRRAMAVAAELVRLGVPQAAITTQAFGESRPLVATADGVREPQNRRVEIVLR